MNIITRHIDGDDSDFDAQATWNAAQDVVYAEPRTAEAVARHLIDNLSDDELDALQEKARIEDGGVDPRGPTAMLCIEMETQDPTGRKWLPPFDARAVMELLHSHAALVAVVAEFVQDVEAAHGREAEHLTDEWPDLLVTYEHAVTALHAARRDK